MLKLKRSFKRNTHNNFFKALAGFGRALNRLYENRNHDILSNGELTILRKISKINPSVIVDGGANIGSYSLLVNELNTNTQIYAFEPVKSTFEKGEIKMIQFEYGYINILTKKLLIDFYNFFESKGYMLGKVFPKTVEFRKYEFKYEDFLGPNFIAVKKTETELIKLLMEK